MDDSPAPASSHSDGVCGTLAELSEIVERANPGRVLVALGERRRRTPIRTLVESCLARGIVVEDAAEFYERLTGQLAIESLAPTSLVYRQAVRTVSHRGSCSAAR